MLKHVRFGSLADIWQVRAMSSLPPIADICQRARDVRLVPVADIAASDDVLLAAAHEAAKAQPLHAIEPMFGEERVVK